MDTGLICPQCHRGDVLRKISGIYAAGTRTTTTRSDNWGMAVDHGHAIPMNIIGSGTATEQSELARDFAPPIPPRAVGTARTPWGWILVVGGILSVFILGAGAAVVLLIGIALLLGDPHRVPLDKQRAYDKELWEWDTTYYCYRCDEAWTYTSPDFYDSQPDGYP